MNYAIVTLLAFELALASVSAAETKSITARSPDGKYSISLKVDALQGRRSIRLSVSRGAQELVEVSPLDVRLASLGRMSDKPRILQTEQQSRDETFALPWGKSAAARNHCSWVRARLINRLGIEWEIELAAYDDGLAYRYVLPQQGDLGAVLIEDETSELHLAGEPVMHFTTCKNFRTDHESEFQRKPLAELPANRLIDLPLLAVWPDGSAAAISEARLLDFADLYLERADPGDTSLRTRLSRLPRTPTASVLARPPHPSPWRVILVADRAGKLLESNLLLCLNDPPAGDFSWVKPGKTTWHWWNGTSEEGLGFDSGMNLATHKRYVDFCARNSIAYHAVVADDRPWHKQEAKDFALHEDTDILSPRPELELPKLIDYAREKGVGIRLWVHEQPLAARLENSFAEYQDWGIRGLMIDFLDRDDQEIVNFCQRALVSAAQNKLHIQFHGSYKPSGEQRTFPNLFNREGVLNLEYLKWSDRCTPPHNVEAAYTRGLAGPTDYHLGGFRSISRAKFVARNENPYVLGTRCHHLAMYVVFENPMPMVADAPSAYEGQPGFEFIVDVPTTWDETRFLAGDAGEYLVIARRKGTNWYLGGMTNWTPRDFKLPLSFLRDGAHQAKLFFDGSLDEEQPNAIRIESRAVDASSALPIAMAPGGGFAAIVLAK